jgi:hypothetical protein
MTQRLTSSTALPLSTTKALRAAHEEGRLEQHAYMVITMTAADGNAIETRFYLRREAAKARARFAKSPLGTATIWRRDGNWWRPMATLGEVDEDLAVAKNDQEARETAAKEGVPGKEPEW